MAYIDKISPEGYHVLTKAEVLNMITALGGVFDVGMGGYTAGNKLKSDGYLNWVPPDTTATNESGFSAIGVPLRDSAGNFGDLFTYAHIWINDESNPGELTFITLAANSDIIQFYTNTEHYSGLLDGFGLSVRLASDTPETFTAGDTFTDLNGNVYPLVKIGDVVVMAQNLRTDKYANGDPIPLAQPVDEWINADGAYCTFDPVEPQYILFAIPMELHINTSAANFPTANFIISKTFSLETSALTLVGGDLTALKTKQFSLSTGAISLSMKPANINSHRTFGLSTGSCGITGNDANIFVSEGGTGAPIIRDYEAVDMGDRYTGIVGTIETNGSDTNVWVEYGRGTDTKINIPLDLLTAGTTDVRTHIIANLPIGTWYWRIIATNSYGTTTTPVQTLSIITRTPWRRSDSTGDKDWAHVPGQTFYIDLDAATNGDGTIESPWNSWANIVWANNRYYLFKRGTTEIRGIYQRTNSMSNVVFGAYGTGDKPKLLSNTTVTSNKIFDLGGTNNNIVISGLEIGGVTEGTRVARLLMNFPYHADGMLIEDCYLHTADTGIQFDRRTWKHQNIVIRNTEIHDISFDGLYVNFADYVTVENVYIHHVNQDYVDFGPGDEEVYPGDGVQYVGCNNVLHEGVVVDRSNSGNKFCVIHQLSTAIDRPDGFEFSEHRNCTYISPLANDGGAVLFYTSYSDVYKPQTGLIRGCSFIGNSSDPNTSLPGLNTTRCIHDSKDNIFQNLNEGIHNSYSSSAITSEDDQFIGCAVNTVGAVTFL